MARNQKEMQHWRQRSHDLLHGLRVLAVSHHQGFVRSQVYQENEQLGEVRGWDLLVVDLIEVRLCSAECC